MARRSGSPARVNTVPRFVIYRSSEAGAHRGWPERDAGRLRSVESSRSGPRARREARRSRDFVSGGAIAAPGQETAGARSEAAEGTNHAVGKEQDRAHEEPAQEEEPEVRIAGGEPALDPVHAERAEHRAVERAPPAGG